MTETPGPQQKAISARDTRIAEIHERVKSAEYHYKDGTYKADSDVAYLLAALATVEQETREDLIARIVNMPINTVGDVALIRKIAAALRSHGSETR